LIFLLVPFRRPLHIPSWRSWCFCNDDLGACLQLAPTQHLKEWLWEVPRTLLHIFLPHPNAAHLFFILCTRPGRWDSFIFLCLNYFCVFQVYFIFQVYFYIPGLIFCIPSLFLYFKFSSLFVYFKFIFYISKFIFYISKFIFVFWSLSFLLPRNFFWRTLSNIKYFHVLFFYFKMSLLFFPHDFFPHLSSCLLKLSFLDTFIFFNLKLINTTTKIKKCSQFLQMN